MQGRRSVGLGFGTTAMIMMMLLLLLSMSDDDDYIHAADCWTCTVLYTCAGLHMDPSSSGAATICS